jgi:hypothetical protein
LPIIPGVERLVVLVDNDRNREGQNAAARAGRVGGPRAAKSCR